MYLVGPVACIAFMESLIFILSFPFDKLRDLDLTASQSGCTMDQNSFIEYENLCNEVFGNLGSGNTAQAREALERISLSQDFVQKAE